MGGKAPSLSRPQLAVGFVLILATVLGATWISERQFASQRWVRHTLVVERGLQGVWIDALDMESSQRGYLLTRRPGFLGRFQAARDHLARDIDAVADLTLDNGHQQTAVRALRAVAVQRVATATEVIRLADRIDARSPEIGRLLDHGAVLMDEVRRITGAMTAEEEALLRRRETATRQKAWFIEGAMGLLALGWAALAAIVFREISRQLTALKASEDRLKATNAQLQAQIALRGKAESQVQQLQKMDGLGQLTGGIAHDFNNMLAVVIGSLDLAKRRLSTDTARANSCIDAALEGANRAAQLTARLLAFARQQPLEPQVLDVNRFVGGMSEMIRRTLGEQVRVETILAGGLWRAFADPSQLENAVLNLAINGRDAMPDGGRLTIETSNAHLDDDYAAQHEVASGQYVLISVTDTGVGMPAEMLSKVFEPFFTTKGAGHGTGLGLSQVYGFIRQSSGHVKIYSEPGHGTAMKLYLPRRFDEGVSHIAPRSRTEDLPRAREHEIVLVVEDDEGVRHVTVDALRELGYTVVQAADASQAMAVLAVQAGVDLLFTDVVMPDVTGRQLAEQALAQWPDLKTLFTTGYTRNAIVHNGVLDPGVAFIAKPFTLDQLARRVRQVLDEGAAG